MSLKSIRESYSKLLSTFNSAGIKLNESQKSDMDTFIVALESTMSKQRKDAILLTKKATERKLEKEYKQVFESIMDGLAENAVLASKIQDKIARINESKKMAHKVNDYLDLYVESVLPKKTIVDYGKMKKLETIHESLKDALLVNDESVKAKKAELEESYKQQKGKLETEVAKMQVKLNESMQKTQDMKKKLDQYKAMQLLESKTKDLPAFEARQIKKRLAEATAPEIEKKFAKTLKSIQRESKEAAEEAQTTLEAEIDKIVDADDVEEDDILKNRNHNGHIPEDDTAQTDEEDFETTESVKFDAEGDVELDDDDVIDESTMSRWCKRSIA